MHARSIIALFTSIFVLMCPLFAQRNPQSHSRVLQTNKVAKTQGWKTVTAYSFNNARTKRKKLVREEQYDTAGHIIQIIDYHYSRSREYEKLNYTYDSVGRITRIFSECSFIRDYTTEQRYSYDSAGRLFYSIRAYGLPANLQFDSTFYFYGDDDRVIKVIDHERNRAPRASYFHYNASGENYAVTNEQGDTIVGRFISRACVEQYGDSFEWVTATYDDQCRELTVKAGIWIKGKAYVRDSEKNTYDSTTLRISDNYQYDVRRVLFHNGRFKSKQTHHWKYECNEHGFRTKTTDFTRRGRVKKIIRYEYETY